MSLEQEMRKRIARYADRREDWNVFGFETKIEPKYGRSQRRYIGASGSVDHAETNSVAPTTFTMSIQTMPGGHRILVNARMYAVTDAARAAWQRIFAWLAERTGIALAPIEHKPPALLSELWRRGDLGCVFMCGWPIARAEPKPKLLAVPVPRPDRYRDRPIYFTDVVVARDSQARTIEDTFGGTVGWTLEDSNSGFNTLRHYLLGFRTPERPRLYSRSIGQLLNPLGALRAVAEGRVDVAPVDSFCHDLFKASGHPVISLTRTIATTPPSPMPALVASPEIPEPVGDALRNALLQAHRDPTLDPELESALVRRFVEPNVGSYDYTERLAQAALAARYPIPA